MSLRRVRVSDFRCLPAADLEFDPRLTLVSGKNGSGKTSLLEALYVLGRGRSFRTRRLENLIRTGAERFQVYAEVDLLSRSTGLGVEGSREGIRAKMAGERIGSLTELAAVLPVQIIDPEIHRLIEEGPGYRRRFLDWGVFHVEHTFLFHWRGFQQALRQRNAALRLKQSRDLASVWDFDVLKFGAVIDDARKAYVALLTREAKPLTERLLGMDLSLSYRSGWPRDTSFEAALKGSWVADFERGSTTLGPQRAELAIRLNGLPVKDRISRGQQKLLAAALLVAQLRMFPRDGQIQPTLLLDDPAAELDDARLTGLIVELTSGSLQLVVTSLSNQFAALGVPGRRYTVNEGVVTADA